MFRRVMRTRPIFIAGAAALALAIPVLAQQAPEPAAAPAQAPSNVIATTAQPAQPTPSAEATPSDETAVEEVTALNLPPPPPPVEYPGWARRDPWVVGSLDPVREGL